MIPRLSGASGRPVWGHGPGQMERSRRASGSGRAATKSGVAQPFSRRQGTPRERPRARVCDASEQTIVRHRPGARRQACRDLLAVSWRGQASAGGRLAMTRIRGRTGLIPAPNPVPGQGTRRLTLERLLSPYSASVVALLGPSVMVPAGAKSHPGQCPLGGDGATASRCGWRADTAGHTCLGADRNWASDMVRNGSWEDRSEGLIRHAFGGLFRLGKAAERAVFVPDFEPRIGHWRGGNRLGNGNVRVQDYVSNRVLGSVAQVAEKAAFWR